MIFPVAAWYNFEFTLVDTDYWSVRYFYYLLYIITSNLRIPSLDSAQMLFCEGFMVSQITCVLWYNELSLSCCLFCLTPWLLIQNAKIALDLMMYEKEPGKKTTFVRLIGAHDSIFIILVYSAMMIFTSIVDSLAYGRDHLLNLLYLPFCLYLFNRLMDEKAEKLARSWLPLLVVIMTLAALSIYFFTQLKTKDSFPIQERSFPLYKGALGPLFGPAEEEPVKQWFWTRIRFDGFWTFKRWVIDPIVSWVFRPCAHICWSAIAHYL